MTTPPILTVSDYVQLPGVAATARYHYGDNGEQFADLYLPAAAPTEPAGYPVVVLIHGGCWGAQYGLAQLGQFSQTIADLGIAVWSLEYRRIGNGGGWPNTFLDVAAGTDFLRTIAAEQQLDLSRVIAAGHSAGGHLVLWLAARPQLAVDSPLYSADPLPLAGVVSLAGIPDLVDAEARDICRGAVPQLMGGPSTVVPEHYRDGSANPFLPLGIPQHLIIGTVDQAVPLIHNERYVAQAQQSGDEVTLTVLPDVGHFEIVIPGTAVWPVVQNALLDMVQRQGR
ncbi:MAG: alpha/beta hydrolase [Caldilineaceae bacterium]|nr:alpha/beta hydrolase [Caldilineaceae bacterium]